MAAVVDVPQAVVNTLNAAPGPPWSQPFTATRHYLPIHEKSDLAALTVTVAPRTIEGERLTRGQMQDDLVIDIAIQQACEPTNDAAIDVLVNIVDAIKQYLRTTILTGTTGARFVKDKNDPIYSPQHLVKEGIFTSILSVTYLYVSTAATTG